MRGMTREIERRRREAHDLAQRDPLTGLGNRLAFDNWMADVAGRGAAEVGLLYLDLDDFKAINDRHGHQRGDEVLLDFARQMQEFVRRSDCFGRIGGEEFMLILPDTTISEGNRILDRLLEKVRSSRPLENIPEFFYTCSVVLAE